MNHSLTIIALLLVCIPALLMGQTGYGSASWNGTNNAGEAVSSGMYMYRIVAGNVAKAGRMLLMK